MNIPVDFLKPIDFFKLYFNNTICQTIVYLSNLYAEQRKSELGLGLEELDAFVGILIVMGFHHLPSIRPYWSTNKHFYVYRIAQVFTVKRFLKIFRFLHLNDNATMPQPKTPNFDRLYKLRPLVDHLTIAFQLVFTPYRHLSVGRRKYSYTSFDRSNNTCL